MSQIEVNKIIPQSGTDVEIGVTGGTITAGSSVVLKSTTEVQTNKISPGSGTGTTLGDSGDTFTVPAGVILSCSGTLTVGGTITGLGTIPGSIGAAGEVLRVNSGASGLEFGTAVAAWESKTTSFTAVASKNYFCDTSGGAIDVTLPTTGTIGDEIHFLDATGTFDTNDLTILAGSHNIQGVAANLDVSEERAGFTLVYYDGTQGWILKDK
jgi:hypothetical protein